MIRTQEENQKWLQERNERNRRKKFDDYWTNKKYIASVKMFQDINGNTTHAVRVELMEGSRRTILTFQRYGYGNHYEYTTIEELAKIGFCGIRRDMIHFNNNGYGLKRDMVEWSKGGYYNKQ